MPRAAPATQQTLRMLRIVHAALLIAILLYAWIPEAIELPATHSGDRTLYGALGAVALLCAAIAFVVRGRMLGPALDAIRKNPADSQAHQRWRVAVLVSGALALAVVLYGFVLASSGRRAPRPRRFMRAALF